MNDTAGLHAYGLQRSSFILFFFSVVKGNQNKVKMNLEKSYPSKNFIADIS